MSDVKDRKLMSPLEAASDLVKVCQHPESRFNNREIPGQAQVDTYLGDKVPKRPTVAEYLKAKHREQLLERLPQFENDTNQAISELQRDLSDLSLQLMFTNWMLAAVVIIGVLVWLL